MQHDRLRLFLFLSSISLPFSSLSLISSLFLSSYLSSPILSFLYVIHPPSYLIPPSSYPFFLHALSSLFDSFWSLLFSYSNPPLIPYSILSPTHFTKNILFSFSFSSSFFLFYCFSPSSSCFSSLYSCPSPLTISFSSPFSIA